MPYLHCRDHGPPVRRSRSTAAQRCRPLHRSGLDYPLARRNQRANSDRPAKDGGEQSDLGSTVETCDRASQSCRTVCDHWSRCAHVRCATRWPSTPEHLPPASLQSGGERCSAERLDLSRFASLSGNSMGSRWDRSPNRTTSTWTLRPTAHTPPLCSRINQRSTTEPPRSATNRIGLKAARRHNHRAPRASGIAGSHAPSSIVVGECY